MSATAFQLTGIREAAADMAARLDSGEIAPPLAGINARFWDKLPATPNSLTW
jgi:hypothetical protein